MLIEDFRGRDRPWTRDLGLESTGKTPFVAVKSASPFAPGPARTLSSSVAPETFAVASSMGSATAVCGACGNRRAIPAELLAERLGEPSRCGPRAGGRWHGHPSRSHDGNRPD